jgi:ABC-type methionine transport system ATPase subunit
MINKRVKFTFPVKLITEPIIYELGRKYEIVTNIRRADVREDMGWVVLELSGKEEEISTALDWVSSTGVRVDPIGGDVVEG